MRIWVVREKKTVERIEEIKCREWVSGVVIGEVVTLFDDIDIAFRGESCHGS